MCNPENLRNLLTVTNMPNKNFFCQTIYLKKLQFRRNYAVRGCCIFLKNVTFFSKNLKEPHRTPKEPHIYVKERSPKHTAARRSMTLFTPKPKEPQRTCSLKHTKTQRTSKSAYTLVRRRNSAATEILMALQIWTQMLSLHAHRAQVVRVRLRNER